MKKHHMRRIISYTTLLHETTPLCPDDEADREEERAKAVRKWRGQDDDDEDED